MFFKIFFPLGKGGLSCCTLMCLGGSSLLSFMANIFRASQSDAGLPRMHDAELHPTPLMRRCAPRPRRRRVSAVRVHGCLDAGDTKMASICKAFCKPVLEQREMRIASITRGWHPVCSQGKGPVPKADWGEMGLGFVGTQNVTPGNRTQCF